MRRLRWKLADYLSRISCWLRGHKWYEPDTWHPVPGNRAAELKQQIWFELMCDKTDPEKTAFIGTKLDELAQLAGENWGHL